MNNIQTFFNIYVRVMGTMNSPVNFVSTKWCDVHWEISGFLFPRIGDTLKFVRKSLLLPIRTVTSKVFLLHTKMYTYSCQLNLQPQFTAIYFRSHTKGEGNVCCISNNVRPIHGEIKQRNPRDRTQKVANLPEILLPFGLL